MRAEKKRAHLEELKKRIQQLKKEKPGYKERFDFYLKIKNEQETVKESLKIETIQVKENREDLFRKKETPLLQRDEFLLDLDTVVLLFQSLCRIGKESNPRLARQAAKIEQLLNNKKLDLKKMLGKGFSEDAIDKTSEQFELDENTFSFFVHTSIWPSVQACLDQLREKIDPETWGKGFCPVCGSAPYLSLLKGDHGKRYLVCSYCEYQWKSDRMICPFCDNRDQESLHYFYGEGEETFRVNLCDQCRQYIKNIDMRDIDGLYPALEDLTTIHLDLIAVQKGYQRPTPNFWIPY
ncbi:MAG: formate dehydrogenase accessory protein FdhE [Pseudomonadota bacterium]